MPVQPDNWVAIDEENVHHVATARGFLLLLVNLIDVLIERALDIGEREEALRIWDNFVPPLVRRADKNAQKLEFYLNIYFAIFPLHPNNPTPQPAVCITRQLQRGSWLERLVPWSLP